MNILDRIVAQKRQEVALLAPGFPTVSELLDLMADRGHPRDFATALRPRSRGAISLIAEVKKASPSAGLIRRDFEPVSIAREYEKSGARCLSVLTDESFFQGSLQFLSAIRKAVSLPLLRKDFIIDSRQIREAVQYGADAILLIVAILSDQQLREFAALAEGAGLAVLVEVHDESELERAMAVGARIIGVNNRDLKTFKVDLCTTERLAEKLFRLEKNRDTLLVAESGIHTDSDVRRLVDCGAQAILVGESLMREKDISVKVRQLLSGARSSD
jgi:indole-3-glycerol phosphate synthase